VLGGGLSLAIALAIGWTITMYQASEDLDETNVETTRNFYGVLRVNHSDNFGDENGEKYELINGRIQHGFQYLGKEASRMPTTYYGPTSGVGMAIEHHPRRGAASAGDSTLRVGVVGLGCGTIAAYGKAGDYVRYYEINPQVIRIAGEYFSYCKDSRAEVDIVLGDARIKMEQELAAGQPQRFDVLAIDAFSSDSIPMHLLTEECVQLYRRHLKPDGLLCLHLSNRFLDLEGVARGVAQVLDCQCVRIESDSDASLGLDSATWVIVTRNQAFLDTPAVRDAILPWTEEDPPPLVWTDDYGSLWQTIRSSTWEKIKERLWASGKD
jgi:SAM-dependent methyltransferase